MGCVASKLEEEGVVVTICKERKRQLKLAVEKRCALAEAHCKYCQALCAVAAAVNLFVSRYSSPPSPFLITFSPPSPPRQSHSHSHPQLTHESNVITNPMFLQQRPSESTHEAIACGSCASSSSSTSSECCDEERREEEEQNQHEERTGERAENAEQGFGYFYMQMPPAMPSPQMDFGWDFFNPFEGVRPEVITGYRRSSEEDLRAVREEEGIPELEEEGEREVEQEEKVVVVEEKRGVENGNVGEVMKVVEEGNVSQGESKGLSVIDTPAEGRELLEALKDIVDLFLRACESAKDVSKMLDANKVRLQSGLEEIKENSTKLSQAISWHSTSSFKASSCKSLVTSSSKSSSIWTEFSNDLFDDYGGMDSGSHSLTLGRLYAWEKKLYEEVKAGDMTRKLYEKKCSRLKHQDVRGDDELTTDKTRAAVKDLYARILVAIRSAESISKRIQILRDEELHPQIVELLKGLMRTWKIMLDCHETQNKILVLVKSFAGSTFGKFCNNSHRLATLQLEAELLNWHGCFTEYVAAQKAYVQALHGWLTKFVAPEEEFYSRGRSSAVPYGVNGPPLFVICHDWLASMEKLPDRAVTFALKSFAKDVRALWTQQGKEQQQKRKVDSLAKELDCRILAFQKSESKFLEPKFTEHKSESDMDHQSEYVTEKKDQLDMFRRKLDVEREKHHKYMQETQRITLNGFQTGFCAVFESLTEFSEASQKMYSDLVTYNESVDKVGNPSYIEGAKVEENGSR